jgi:hypothetical protein
MNSPIRNLLLVAVVALSGCQVIERLQTIEDLSNGETTPEDVLKAEVADALGVGVAGLSPSPGYSQNGQVDLSLISRGSDLNPEQMRVEVKNRDGSYSECEYTDGVEVGASPVNALSLLIDGSGSMERTYYEGECDTCPHDPGRERVGAAARFVETLFDVAPDSRLAIAEFGPEPSAGMSATYLHTDFDTNPRRLESALDYIGGDQPLGTPLYDSLYEMIDATADEAEFLSFEYREGIQRHVVVLSDGIDTASDWYDLDDVIDLALQENVVVYVVGLGPASASDTRFDDADLAVRDLQTLASATGGFYAGVDDPSRLHQLFDNVAYALAGGYERQTYHCIPRDNASSVIMTPPTSGTRVEGRVLETTQGGEWSNWAFIAP